MTIQEATPEVAETRRPASARRPARPAPETELSLLLDVGSAWTKAALVGRAGGRWRIVSGVAQPTAWGETALIEDLVARLTPHADARLHRRLVLLVRDAPRITCRSPRRLHSLVVVADTVGGLERVRTTVERAGWVVAAAVAGDDAQTDDQRFTALAAAEPDAWVLVVGPGAAAEDAAADPVWALAAAARGVSEAPVLASGPDDTGISLAATFGIAPRVVGPEPGPALADALLTILSAEAGLSEPRGLAPVAFGRAMAALSRGLGIEVAGVDLGATWLTWAPSSAGGEPEEGPAVLAVTPGTPLPEGSRTAAELLPTDVDEFAAADSLANLAAHPASVPGTPVEAAIVQAVAIDRLAAARRSLGRGPQVDLVVGGGRLLAGSSHPADAALVLLDGVRPAGVTQLALDAWGICGPLGALPGSDVDEGLETLRDDLLTPLGTAVVVHGGRPGQVAFRARLRRPGWPDSGAVDVRSGTVVTVPLERGALGEVELELERGVELGRARRGRRVRAAVTGGAVGVILDARDDPIQLPARPGDARAVVQSWRDALRREGRPAAAAG